MRSALRPPIRPVLALVVVLAVAACSGDYQPGWTFSPATAAPSPSASGSAGPSPTPSGSASVEPSVNPSASASVVPSPAPSGSADAGDAVQISALNVVFEQAAVEAPADTAFTIHFENKDAGIPHNVAVKDAAGATVYEGEIFNGVDSRDYPIPPLTAGDYQFVCTVHPNMVGTLAAG